MQAAHHPGAKLIVRWKRHHRPEPRGACPPLEAAKAEPLPPDVWRSVARALASWPCCLRFRSAHMMDPSKIAAAYNRLLAAIADNCQ